ncbi:MAG: calcium-binding protein [Nocardioidaceae bacterium]
MRTLRPVLAVVGLAAGGLVIAPQTASAALPPCQGVQATIVGTDARDDLTGTNGRDVIVGLGGWDSIDGLGGNDLICGGEGTDGLRGGPGNDQLYGGPDGRVPDEPPLPVGDTLRGGPGDDRLDGGADGGDDRVSYDTSTNGVVVDLGTGRASGQGDDTLVGIEAATGSASADRLVAARSTVSLVGSGGDDVLRGLAAAEFLHLSGDAGDDRVVGPALDASGGPGTDHMTDAQFMYGGPGPDQLVGGDGEEWIEGEDGADTIRAGGGADQIYGGPGANDIDAGAGNDYVRDGRDQDVTQTGDGDDIVQPTAGDDETFDLGAGDDTISFLQLSGVGVRVDLAAGTSTGVGGSDTLVEVENAVGSYGDDVLLGTDAGEHLDAWTGSDTIDGRGGDDVIDDDYGPDSIDAGAGDDVIRLSDEVTGKSDDAYLGGDGVDTLNAVDAFPGLDQALVVDLGTGVMTGNGQDTVEGLENVIGWWGEDVLRGDDGPNRLEGRDGNDTLVGRGGDDELRGGLGTDDADGGPGQDICAAAETVANCEG